MNFSFPTIKMGGGRERVRYIEADGRTVRERDMDIDTEYERERMMAVT